jgi:hypothetical protein
MMCTATRRSAVGSVSIVRRPPCTGQPAQPVARSAADTASHRRRAELPPAPISQDVTRAARPSTRGPTRPARSSGKLERLGSRSRDWRSGTVRAAACGRLCRSDRPGTDSVRPTAPDESQLSSGSIRRWSRQNSLPRVGEHMPPLKSRADADGRVGDCRPELFYTFGERDAFGADDERVAAGLMGARSRLQNGDGSVERVSVRRILEQYYVVREVRKTVF